MICPILSVFSLAPRPCLGPVCMLYIEAGAQWCDGKPSGWCALAAPDSVKAGHFGPFLREPGAPGPYAEAVIVPAAMNGPAPALAVGDVEALAEATRAKALADAIARGDAAATLPPPEAGAAAPLPPQAGAVVVFALADNPGAFPEEAAADPGFSGVIASLIGVPFQLLASVDNPIAAPGRVSWLVRDAEAVEPLLRVIGRSIPAVAGMPVWTTIERAGCAVESVDARQPPAAPEAPTSAEAEA